LADPARALQMGQAGRARAEALFDLHRNVAQLAHQFRALPVPRIVGAA
jgi:hypothetical protein